MDYNQVYFISEKTFVEWEKRGTPQIGDVLLTTEGPLGEVAQLDKQRVALAQRLIALRGKEKTLDNAYLKYFLMSPTGQHELFARASGTTVQGIKQSEFRKIKIIKPTFPEQRLIAKILSDLDGKIALNLKMNNSLEAVGEAVFKRWFVDFEFPNEEDKPYKTSGGKLIDSKFEKIPPDWKIGKLNDVCEKITDGSHYSPKESLNGNHVIATVSDMGIYDFDLDKCKRISEEDYTLLLKRECKPKRNDILFSKDGTMGITFRYLGHQDIVLLSSIAILRPKKDFFSNYVYFYLKSQKTQDQIFMGYVSGSALPRIVLKDFKLIPILIPPDHLLIKFNSFFDPLFEAIIIHNNETRSLNGIKNALLPRLMSGKIRVPISNGNVEAQ